jgi:hypothetical protein
MPEVHYVIDPEPGGNGRMLSYTSPIRRSKQFVEIGTINTLTCTTTSCASAQPASETVWLYSICRVWTREACSHVHVNAMVRSVV